MNKENIMFLAMLWSFISTESYSFGKFFQTILLGNLTFLNGPVVILATVFFFYIVCSFFGLIKYVNNVHTLAASNTLLAQLLEPSEPRMMKEAIESMSGEEHEAAWNAAEEAFLKMKRSDLFDFNEYKAHMFMNAVTKRMMKEKIE